MVVVVAVIVAVIVLDGIVQRAGERARRANPDAEHRRLMREIRRHPPS